MLTKALSQVHSSQTDDLPCSATFGRPCDLILQPVRVHMIHHTRSFIAVYDWALSFMDLEQVESGSVQNVSRVCATLLYNLGLCFQALGSQRRVDQDLSNRKAMRSYDAALSILNSCSCTERLLRLALLNNLGFLMACYCNYSATHQYLSALRQLLATFDRVEDVERDDILEIHLNCALFYDKHAHAAAA